MTLGERLQGYLKESEKLQKAVSLEWLDKWTQRTGEQLSHETVPSRLSGLLHDRDEGIRFFFRDRTRATMLMDILQVPNGDREELMRLGDEAVEHGQSPLPRLIIDITHWGSERRHTDTLFLAIEKRIAPTGVTPIVVVMTKDQYRYLPRTFDDFEPQVKSERVADPQEGWERTQKLANEHAVVISARRYPAFHRWIAAHYDPYGDDENALLLEPPDGLEILAKGGTLPMLPEVAHPLEQLGIEPSAGKVPTPDSATELRRWMVGLASEPFVETFEYSIRARLRLAMQLGVRATSTTTERRNQDFTAAAAEQGLKITAGQQAELDRLLGLAHRRPAKPMAFRVDDVLHLINPKKPVSERQHGQIQVHAIECAPPALSRLLEVAKQWTVEDWLVDPYLEDAIARLDPERTQRIAYLHARAQLLHAGIFQPQATPLQRDWLTTLTTLLQGPPPAAQLRLSLESAEHSCPFLLRERGEASGDENETALSWVPPVGPLLVSREDRLCVVSSLPLKQWKRPQYSWGANFDDLDDLDDLAAILCIDTQKCTNVVHWLDFLELSPCAGGDAEQIGRHVNERIVTKLLNKGHETKPIKIPEELWIQSDRQMATCWWAMQTALPSARSFTMYNNTGMLKLGEMGIFAEVHAYPCASDEPIAALDLPLQRDNYEYRCSSLLEQVTTHQARSGSYTTMVGHTLPRAIYLRGSGLGATIRFHASPLFATSADVGDTESLSAATAERLIAQLRANDDDDY